MISQILHSTELTIVWMIKRTVSVVIVIVIVIVLVDGEAADSPGKPARFLFLDDVTTLEVDRSF